MTGAAERPPIGARVRIRGNTGIHNVAGRVGHVVTHHIDGASFHVDLVIGRRILVRAENVDQVHSGDVQPARVGGSEA